MAKPIRGLGGHLGFPIGPKKTPQTWQRTSSSCFLSSFVKFPAAFSVEKSKMSRPIRGRGSHLGFPIGPSNTNLVENIEILLPVKFSLNSVRRFQGRGQKCSSQSEARVAILIFRLT